jgi:competence protein ComEC
VATGPIPTVWSRDFHFLDVGHGDCSIVDIPDRLTVIDINNCRTLSKESETELRNRYSQPMLRPLWARPYSAAASVLGSGLGRMGPDPNALALLAQAGEAERKLKEAKDKLTNPIHYLKARFPGRSIFRYIQTHPDMDHMAGIHRLLEEGIGIENLWDTHHCLLKDEDAMRTGEVNHDIQDWHTYLRLRNSPANPTVLRLTSGAQGDFWTADGIYIWAPLDHRNSQNPNANPNALSYVLLFEVGKCKIVLGGDATEEMWQELFEKYTRFPKVHLLKASHHGRKSGYHREIVKAMNPDVTILSVGELKGKDDATASYERFSVKGCYSTVDHGDIIAKCWSDGDVWLRERDGDWFLKTFQA